ncbi:putative wall-associated receptor kinase-like 13 [Morella rubra]|uniref:Putative wall-associated receptor kinase-like 13 n=1 Tax=Morella rubra TaxID=262757 RepID=A0A6A1VEL3_9ROSI|nr:putative wall-associated receptor kinase-like 13 [Morella rubra]
MGCNSAAIRSLDGSSIRGRCKTLSCNKRASINASSCNGTNCCQTKIPLDLDAFRTEIVAINYTSEDSLAGYCNYAFLVEQAWLETANIDECADPADQAKYRCGNKRCHNIDGSYLCSGFPVEATVIDISTGLGLIVLLVGGWLSYKVVKRKMMIKNKDKFFKRNDGLLLLQQLSSSEHNTENPNLFALKDLEKATDQFYENRILSDGGQGTAYKGRYLKSDFIIGLLGCMPWDIIYKFSRERPGVTLVAEDVDHSLTQNSSRVLKEAEEEEIIMVASLAKRCLNISGKDRPTMKEVSMELEATRLVRKAPNLEKHSEALVEDVKTEMHQTWDVISTSTMRGREMGVHMVFRIILVLWSVIVFAQAASLAKSSCQDRCGNVSVPFPFGIGSAGCYVDDWFAIVCNGYLDSPRPFLRSFEELEVLEIQLDGTVRVKYPTARTSTKNETGVGNVNLEESPFVFSQSKNRFTAMGCNNYGSMKSLNSKVTYGGCSPGCEQSGSIVIFNASSCNGINCCQFANIPSYLNAFITDLDQFIHNDTSQECRYAFLEQEWFETKNVVPNLSFVPVVL